MHSRVGNFEAFFLDMFVSVKQQVKIDNSRFVTPMERRFSQRQLNHSNCLYQFLREEYSFYSYHSVQEFRAIIVDAHRFGLVKARLCSNTSFRQLSEGAHSLV